LYNNFNSNNGSLTSIQNSLGFIGNASTNYLDTKFNKPQYTSNYYIENASFFRLDNINVGYNFGKIFKSNYTLSINGSIQNVLVVTKYSGADPENTGGVDNNIYPRPRIYSVGANINF
jgi:TonB-dependent starch-binding outer membrane protein SusC